MSKILKVAIIGVGGISNTHIPGWNASENLFKMHEYIKSDMKDYDWIVSMSVDCTLHPTYRIKDLMKKLGITEEDVENIFDLIEEEIPEL